MQKKSRNEGVSGGLVEIDKRRRPHKVLTPECTADAYTSSVQCPISSLAAGNSPMDGVR